MQVELVRSDSELDRLGPEWNKLVAASEMDNPFLQWEWCSTWWRHYGAGHELAVVLVREGRELIGLAPLYTIRAHGLPQRGVMKFLGTGEVCSEYLGFVLSRGREGDAGRALLHFILNELPTPWGSLRLSELVATSPLVPVIAGALHEFGHPFRCERRKTAWSIELADSWEEFSKRLSRNRREKIRRARRDMEKNGLEFFEVTGEGDLDAAWNELKRLHQLRWGQRGQRGCFASPRFSAFHGELLRPLLRRGMLKLSGLRRGGETIAASYCLTHRSRVLYYQGGVDPAWMECRPGHVLRVCELHRAIERGDRVYDFLGGDEDYKQQWATHQTPILQFIIPARGLVPRTTFELNSAAYWLKESARDRLSKKTWARLSRWKRLLSGQPSQV